MVTAEKAIREFISGEPSSYKIYEMEDPDVLLWAVWALQQYAKETSEMLKGVGDVLRTYSAAEKYELVKELISPHLNGMFMLYIPI